LAGICQNRNYHKILDFGGGTGGTLIYIESVVHSESYYYDLKGVLRDFAEWRVAKRVIPNFYFIDKEDDLNDVAPYDFIVCLDVFEHIENPPKYATWLSSMLRKDGMMFISAPFLASGEKFIYPMHLERNQKYAKNFNDILASTGLQRQGENLWLKI
jgi:2-polyprenyl-3-methyl-5-hydroxy-6-metoxy-1,4-benzoquinol methylase